jgi:hypothetical protein
LAKRFSAMAWAARFWLSSARPSSAARGMPSSVAIASAQMPWCDLRVVGAQTQVACVHHRGAVLGTAATGHRHHLGAAGDHQVFHAGHDLRRSQRSPR